MKKIFSFLFLLMQIYVFSQTENSENQQFIAGIDPDTVYLNKFGDVIKNTTVDFAKYRVISKNPNEVGGQIIRIYYKSGAMYSEQFLCRETLPNNPTKHKNVFCGIYREWHENGKLKTQASYLDNKYYGEFSTYWPNGVKKRIDIYDEGKVVEGTCFDSIGKKIEYFKYDIRPQFPGGDSELSRFISKHMKYPVEAQEKGLQGKVKVQFTVKKNGEICDIVVLKSPGIELENESLRIISLMPNWTPCSIDGEIIDSQYTLTLGFNLTQEFKTVNRNSF